MDPRQEALTRLDGLLAGAANAPLSADACMQMVELVALVPGRLRRVAETLAAQRSYPAMEALIQLPTHVPGVVEGMYQALAHGVARCRLDGSPCNHMIAIDFRHSRARDFASLLTRARAMSGPAFEQLLVEGRTHYRFSLRAGRGTLAGRVAAAAHDLQWLHRRLSRLRGTRLWLNGWCFTAEGAVRPAVQTHLVAGWLGWAARQTHTST
jgi:hypothetical protein